MMPHRSTVASFILLSILVFVRNVTAADGIPDGQPCYLTAPLTPVKPCAGGIGMCVVSKIPQPGTKGLLEGVCNSTYDAGLSCVYTSQPYAVNTRFVPGNPNCATCKCTRHWSRRQRKEYATCDCPNPGVPQPGQTLQSCARSVKGAYVGKPCKADEMCLVKNVGGAGTDSSGNPIDAGVCITATEVYALGGQTCTSAGPTWGMTWYAIGTGNVPRTGDWCTRCSCKKKGLLNCAKVANCKVPS